MKACLDKIHFKTYCWSIGNTSFRMSDFNYNIEQQLIYLKEFFAIDENKSKDWKNNPKCQKEYYYFLKDKGFVKGDAPNPSKDAREKTSGLVDLGLIDDNRRITEVGNILIDISINNDFNDNNFFAIDKDSYIYLGQLLKYSTEDNIRPFVVLLKTLNDLDSITEEEFKYLLPLATTKSIAKDVVDSIVKHRSGQYDIDDLIINIIRTMENYRNAFQYFLDSDPSENLFMLINMNRKSPNYEKPYYNFFIDFVDVYVNGNINNAIKLLKDINKIKGKAGSYWKKLIFSNTNKNTVINSPSECLNNLNINCSSTDYEIKEFFFYKTHLYKWKSTLDDYYDLNRRYFKITDIVLFEDNKISLTTTAKYFFKHCINDFFDTSFSKATDFTKYTRIEDILGKYAPNIELVYEDVSADFDEEYLDPSEINDRLEVQRLDRFKELIKNKFSNDKLLYYLDCFEQRNDAALNHEITEDADAPTLFEYIMAICWYKISNQEGNILKYMNLSLDSNLLPKRHAGGLESDIVYSYTRTKKYPAHNLLLEVTLTESTNQRRAEMEPVSRHLMRQIEVSKNNNDYAILAATYVSPAVVADFRSKANHESTLDGIKFFDNLKLMALDTEVIKMLLKNGITYDEVYKVLDEAHKSNVPLSQGWYKKEVVNKLIK